MGRAVTADHILFKECIPIFRPPTEELTMVAEGPKGDLSGYLLVDFNLTKGLKLPHFELRPTVRVQLPNAYAAFISPVELPKWVEHIYGHLFTIALSSVISFAIGRPVKSPRDFYLFRKKLTNDDWLSLGIQFPVLVAGPGAHESSLAKGEISKYHEKIKDFISVLYRMPYERYVDFMQAVRLVHLAQLNHRDDFALAYSLLIAAIESIARIAIPRDLVKDKHPSEKEWVQRVRSDSTFKELLTAYKKERGKNQYLGQRFVEFILAYCPIKLWDELEHPLSNTVSNIAELTCEPPENWRWLTEKKWFDIYPSDLPEEYIRKILIDAYKDRSGFVHQGKSPPHWDPNSSNRFFERVIEYNDLKRSIRELIVPNFRLMYFIARRSISNFAKGCVNNLKEDNTPFT
jgi:hypothetical protein